MENENQSQPQEAGKKKGYKKWVIIAVVVIIFYAIGSSSVKQAKERADEQKNKGTVTQTEQKTESNSQPAVTEANADKKESQPSEPLSEEEQIKQLVTSQFKGKNNLDKDYIKGVEVVKQIDGGWGVFVEYNADDNFSANMRKKSIELDMSKIYTALYTSEKDIQTASVSAYFPLTDKYGNTSDGVVYKSILDKTEADKVNWETDSSYLGLQVLPGVWETAWIHSEFQQ